MIISIYNKKLISISLPGARYILPPPLNIVILGKRAVLDKVMIVFSPFLHQLEFNLFEISILSLSVSNFIMVIIPRLKENRV